MKKIKIGGVPEHFNYPWKIGIKKGLFKQAGIDLTWIDFHGGTGEMSEALETGEVDLAIMLTEGSIKQIADHKPFKILQKYIETPLYWGIYVKAGSIKNKIEDLKNDTIGVSRLGSGSHLMAYINAKSHNWNYNELDFTIANNLEGLKKSIHSESSDYFMWEHFTTKPLVDQGELKHIEDVPTPWPCFVIVTTKQFYNQNKKIAEDLLQIINQITKKVKSQKNLASEIAQHYQQKENDVIQWLNQTEWSQHPIKINEFAKVKNELVSLNLIDTKIEFENI